MRTFIKEGVRRIDGVGERSEPLEHPFRDPLTKVLDSSTVVESLQQRFLIS